VRVFHSDTSSACRPRNSTRPENGTTLNCAVNVEEGSCFRLPQINAAQED
jgi:hypothetical protein